MENEEDQIMFHDDFNFEVLDGFEPEERRLPGPLVPPLQLMVGTPHEDIQTAVTSWNEQEKLHNKINNLLTENADLKAERDAKKSAIEGLSIARERLHKERTAMNEELEHLREQVRKADPHNAAESGSTTATQVSALLPYPYFSFL